MEHLVPEETDWMYRILILFARYELCTDQKFISYLESLDTKCIEDQENDEAEIKELDLSFEKA